ncbi:MAG TPA: ABC transporter ATP-binding protein [Desulfomicrobiaceae bacterium]|nr:ABC transporter ATP-binding protein [Desulfomicrobiaceae bacterium]
MTASLLSLTDITRTFLQGDQRIEVLKSISLDIRAGEFLALLGTSGSGKSTLMHILGLLDRPSAGTFLLNGRDVSEMDDDGLSELRNRTIGFIFQSFYLIPYASALDNVLLPGLYSPTSTAKLRKRAQDLLSLVGLGDRMHFKPSQLSGGQQQRVAIARALINDPDILLADEPTGQLDSATSTEIMTLMADINSQGKTVILVTHDESTAAVAKRKIYMEDGRIGEGG